MSAQTYARFSAALLAAGLLASACVQPPEYPIEPVLTFEGLSRDTMIQGSGLEDSLSLFLSFTDGDGDIAAADGDSNVFIRNVDSDQLVDFYSIDPIPTEGAENGISGDLRLRVFTTCCEYPEEIQAFPCDLAPDYPVDTLRLEAYIVDAAGNESNRVDVAPIILRCDRLP